MTGARLNKLKELNSGQLKQGADNAEYEESIPVNIDDDACVHPGIRRVSEVV